VPLRVSLMRVPPPSAPDQRQIKCGDAQGRIEYTAR
jgi:hypothetical protein